MSFHRMGRVPRNHRRERWNVDRLYRTHVSQDPKIKKEKKAVEPSPDKPSHSHELNSCINNTSRFYWVPRTWERHGKHVESEKKTVLLRILYTP